MEKNEIVDEAASEDDAGVDEGLVAYFLSLTPDERLEVNDMMAQMILELRSAYQAAEKNRHGPKINS